MPVANQPQLRADARRNRERILAAAGRLFARDGRKVQMDEIAVRSGLGIGTLYRHFPNKEALLAEIVRERFGAMAGIARQAEDLEDPGAAFEAMLLTYLEAAEKDVGFQLAVLGSDEFAWHSVRDQKEELMAIVSRIIDRAVDAGAVRSDLKGTDFPLISCGLMSTMYFEPGEGGWRRHLQLVLDGLRPPLT